MHHYAAMDRQHLFLRIRRLGRYHRLGETKPCEQMEAALPGLRKVMYDNWGGGAFGEVLEGGVLHVGDIVSWEAGA